MNFVPTPQSRFSLPKSALPSFALPNSAHSSKSLFLPASGSGSGVCRKKQAFRGLRVRAGDDGALTGAPWEILEVPIDADEKTIKKAYRHLALRNHPDINSSPDAPFKFHKISEAYEMLMDRKRGKDYVEQKSKRRHSDWSFHDWYWDFMLQQRHKAQGGPTKAKPVLQEDHLHGQLAGLRRRAAGRRRKEVHDEAADPTKGGTHSSGHDVPQDPVKSSGLGGHDAPSYAFAHEGSTGLSWAEEAQSDQVLGRGEKSGHPNPADLKDEEKREGDFSHRAPLQDELGHEDAVGKGHHEPRETRTEPINDHVEINRQLQGLKRRAARRQ